MRFTDRLLDTAEAGDWNSAYPLGNGSMGVMVDGGIAKACYYLNDDTFWSGNGEGSFRANDVMDKVREFAMAKQYHEASDLLWHDVYGEYAESYLPLGTIHVERSISSTEAYVRTLDLCRAVHSVSDNGFSEQCFVSHPSRVFVVYTSSDVQMDETISFTADVRYSVESAVLEGGDAIIRARLLAPSHNDPVGHPTDTPVVYDEERPGLSAYAECRVKTDGVVSAEDGKVNITKCTYIYMTFTATTSMRDDDIEGAVENILDSVEGASFEELLEEHVRDYQSLYNRASIELTHDQLPEDMPTIKGLKKYSKHPEMAHLIFNYGRYLMIAGSREDSYCMNLQGIWNKDFKPPWSSAFTVNINIEMNYWIAETTGLSECHMPLMRQLKVLEKSGRRTAREQLHTAGWCCGHNSDIWGHSNLTGRISHFDPTMYALYLSGGAWLATHIYIHYRYTRDIDFLREYYYILRGAAEFYIDYAREDNESEYLVLCPGSSPENTFKMGNIRSSLSKNATMDSAIARHILSIVEECSEILGTDEDFREQCKSVRQRLYPYKIARHGELQEWYGDYDETERAHRHISHLYGLYPGEEITLEHTPELVEAAKKTLKRRGDRGNIGWSLAWKTCFYARLGNAKMAEREIAHKLKLYNKKMDINYGGCYPNLFSAPPMQIDGNFGITAGITEMLLQSYDTIHLLPALPKSWANGSFAGLKAVGGYSVDCKWLAGRVTEVKVDGEGDTIDIIANGVRHTIRLGEITRL